MNKLMVRPSHSRLYKLFLTVSLVFVVFTLPIHAKTTVRFAMWGMDQEVKTYQRIIEQFEADNPEIEVEFEYSGWGEYWDKVQIQMLGGSAPDVIRMSGAYLEQFARDGALYNVQPLIERDQFPIDTDEYFDVSGIFKVDGNYFGLPEGGDMTALYYNVDMFDVAGLTYPSADWTWEDLRQAAKRLTVRENETIMQWGLHTMFFGDGQMGYQNFILQAGGRLLNKEKTKATVESPAVCEALRFLQGMVLEDNSTVPPFGGDALESFTSARVAMLTGLLPVWINLFDSTSFEWDVAPLPMGKQRASTTNFCGFSIPHPPNKLKQLGV